MIKLRNGMLLYHGSYQAVPLIDLDKCTKGLDFGKGFYVTSSYEQALKYIPSSVKKNIKRRILPKNFNLSQACVSIYRLNMTSDLTTHCFDSANIDWLHFVASNRNDFLFHELKKRLSDTDIIGGKIANDNTAMALNAYVNGDYGVPVVERVDKFTIESLLPNELEDQFCFRSLKAVKALEFLRSELYKP